MHTDTMGWVNTQIAGNRYSVMSVLGAGGMGMVYRAFDNNLEADVIIKVPKRAMLDDPHFVERFSQEIRSLVKLQHPHIVRVSDVGEHDGLPFAIMTFLGGGDLTDRQPTASDGSKLPFDVRAVRSWLPGVAAALDFIHGQGYVHRDVKPANILFDEHHNVYLSDFGVAKVVAATEEPEKNLTGTGMVMGTPEYMSPELIMGEDWNHNVDQFALGVTVYEMLCGHPPIQASSPAAVLVKLTTEKFPQLFESNPLVPREVSGIVMKALARDPAQRWANCRTFAEHYHSAIERALASGNLTSAPTNLPPAPTTSQSLACTNCNKQLTIPAEAAGKVVRCPQCETRLRVNRWLTDMHPADDVPHNADAPPPSSTFIIPQTSPPITAETNPGTAAKTQEASSQPSPTPKITTPSADQIPTMLGHSDWQGTALLCGVALVMSLLQIHWLAATATLLIAAPLVSAFLSHEQARKAAIAFAGIWFLGDIGVPLLMGRLYILQNFSNWAVSQVPAIGVGIIALTLAIPQTSAKESSPKSPGRLNAMLIGLAVLVAGFLIQYFWPGSGNRVVSMVSAGLQVPILLLCVLLTRMAISELRKNPEQVTPKLAGFGALIVACGAAAMCVTMLFELNGWMAMLTMLRYSVSVSGLAALLVMVGPILIQGKKPPIPWTPLIIIGACLMVSIGLGLSMFLTSDTKFSMGIPLLSGSVLVPIVAGGLTRLNYTAGQGIPWKQFGMIWGGAVALLVLSAG